MNDDPLVDASPVDLAYRVVVARARHLRRLHEFGQLLDTPPIIFATAERLLRQAVDEFTQLCLPPRD